MALDQNIFEGLIQPQHGNFSAEHARYVLSLDFSPQQHARYQELSTKAAEASLSASERDELEQLLAADSLLTILRSKARNSLQKHPTAA